MAMLPGLPDLGSPVAGIPGVAYRGFGRAGLVVAIPDRLTLEAEADGRPRLRLTLMRGGGTASSAGGRLELGVSIGCDLEGIGRVLAAEGTPSMLTVADVEGGVLAINALLGPLSPTLLAAPQHLPPDLLTRARVMVELGAETSVIVSRIIEDATLPVTATLRLVVRAVAPRVPLAVTYDPKRVAERLAGRFGDGAAVTIDDLAGAIESLLEARAIIVEGDLFGVDPELWGRTAALRMSDRFTARAAADPGNLKLVPARDVPTGRERMDLAEPAAVIVEQVLSIDPVSAARSMRHGPIGDLVRRLEIPPVPTGRQRLAVSANLPEPVAGLEALRADFRAPGAPPFRPLPISASVSLDPPERRAEAEVKLAPGERLAGDIRLRAVLARQGQAIEIAGPWRAIDRAEALLGPADFGVPLTVVRVSPAITALAAVEAVIGETVVARLDGATPMTAVPLTDGGLRIVLRPLGGGRPIEVEAGGRRRIDLDLATLPGFGAHRARLVAAEAEPFVVEWRAEGDPAQEPLSLRMGADRRVAEIGWVAASPFRPGLVWRIVRDGAAGAWSEPVLPQDDLVIEIGEKRHVQA